MQIHRMLSGSIPTTHLATAAYGGGGGAAEERAAFTFMLRISASVELFLTISTTHDIEEKSIVTSIYL